MRVLVVSGRNKTRVDVSSPYSSQSRSCPQRQCPCEGAQTLLRGGPLTASVASWCFDFAGLKSQCPSKLCTFRTALAAGFLRRHVVEVGEEGEDGFQSAQQTCLLPCTLEKVFVIPRHLLRYVVGLEAFDARIEPPTSKTDRRE